MPLDSDGYLETPDVLRLARVRYSTLDYWVRQGLVAPSVRTGQGRRKTRRWSVTDVVCVRALGELREAGCPTRILVRARDLLEGSWERSLSAQTLFWDGQDLFLDRWEQSISLVRQPGQATLQVVALRLDVIADEVEDALRLRDVMEARASLPDIA